MESKFDFVVCHYGKGSYKWKIGIDICYNSRETYLQISLFKIVIGIGKIAMKVE